MSRKKEIVQSGLESIRQGDLRAARKLFESVATADRGFNANYGLGMCYLDDFMRTNEQEFLDKAIEYLEAAHYRFSGHFDVNFSLAQCYAAQYWRTGDTLSKRKAVEMYLEGRKKTDSTERIARIDDLLLRLHDGTRLVSFTTMNRGIDASKDLCVACYDTSTNAPRSRDMKNIIDASELSPFFSYGGIPVPGTDELSDSVEGIWQGLKIIKGRTDHRFFIGKGRKRHGSPSGHMLGCSKLNYREARRKIYITSYRFMLKNRVHEDILRQIFHLGKSGIRQLFFDVDSNGDVGNLNSPLAHSAVLVDYINKEILPHNRFRYD